MRIYKTQNEKIVYRIVKAKEKRECKENDFIQIEQPYYRVYEIIPIKDDKPKLQHLFNLCQIHVNLCELCKALILESDKRFCCVEHANISLERENRDFETKMYDKGICVNRM